MGEIIVMPETSKKPISLIGKCAGICWGANTENSEKNYKRGIECIENRHGRTLEFPEIYLTIDGYSARVIRELYTHIGGAPTRLQASTRYINYEKFPYVTPPSIKKSIIAKTKYDDLMQEISECFSSLIKLGFPKEDVAMMLPLGMETKIVFRVNLRELIQIFNQRLCTRAYWEFRELMTDIKNALIEYGNTEDKNQWKVIADNWFVPKCELDGVCYEKNNCGRRPKAEQRKIN